MKLPYKWIKEYVDVNADPKTYAHKMTMSGSKVEGYECLGDIFSNVVMGRVEEIKQHPAADRLVVCQVNIGKEENIQICTAATNLKVGDYVPAALHGAKLPGGISIKKTKMRGEESNGMFCSVAELGVTLNDFPNAIEDGILVFDEPTNLGEDVKPYMGLDEIIFEFEITPNRPDCLSAIGLAKETAATFGLPFKGHEPEIKETEGDIHDYISVKIESDLCARYTGALVKDVKIEPSPMWMRQRLRDCGIRPINNIVDITNYVMLEYGQPMHAFDYSCITDKEIVVRTAKPGEQIETLDGNMRDLPENALVIADKERAIGVAGVMGGANSEITENTKMIAFEAGNFNGVSIRNTSRKLGMRTEASGRFEKGLDAEKTLPAIMRALELVEMLGAGKVVGGITDVYPNPKQQRVLPVEYDKINALIGIQLTNEEIDNYLNMVECFVENGMAKIPFYRDDIERTADLAEEVARLYGYDMIPSTINAGETTQGGYSDAQKFEKNIKTFSMGLGYSEMMTLSFIGEKVFDKLHLAENDAKRIATVIMNPLGEDQKLMRTTSVHSALEIVARNYNFNAPMVKLFEIAKTYSPKLDENGKADMSVLPDEYKILTMANYGAGDFFAIKGAVEALFKALSIKNFTFEPCKDNVMYHPGRTAVIMTGDKVFGTIGQIHPVIAKEYGIDTEVYMAEIDTEVMFQLHEGEKVYKALPKYPAATRDLALLCDEDVPVIHLENAIREVGGKMLEDVKLFDVFRHEKLGAGKKSVAFSLTLRNSDHTITDEEVDKVIRKALINLEKKCGAALRS